MIEAIHIGSQMTIRQQEDALFDAWAKRYIETDSIFTVDGAPSPSAYEASSTKCVFVLKDVNWGSGEKVKQFDLREQLSTKPHDWWRTVANWCTGISNIEEDLDWAELQLRDLLKSLQPHAFIQLKKAVGGPSIDRNTLENSVKNNGDYFLKQLAIYKPKTIVCCGVGQIVAELIGYVAWSHTRHGVRYTEVQIDGGAAILIDYMHPSARAAKNIVCYGLLDAYREVNRIQKATTV